MKWIVEDTKYYTVEADSFEEACKKSTGDERTPMSVKPDVTVQPLPLDENGNRCQSVSNKKGMLVFYTPVCKYGFDDCILDPARAAAFRGTGIIDSEACDCCEDASWYDDEDK